jgi:oxygen-dependent protoporphyrinogen oxidase
MTRIAIIGGGITGLTAAFGIEQHNKNASQPIDYVVIERAKRLGGKVFTENIDGFRIEAGPDCFVAEKPAINQLADQLSIRDRILTPNESSKRSFIYSNGRIHQLPEGLLLLIPTKITPFLLSPLVSWRGKARMSLDLLIPRKKDDSDETLASFVRRRLGKEILDKIAAPLVGGIHSNDPETMSLQASFPRFLKMEEDYGSMARAMLAARLKTAFTKSRTGGGHFLSFQNGMGELTTALAAGLDKNKIRTGSSAMGIEKIPGKERTTYRVLLDPEGSLEVDAVVLAAVAHQTARMLRGIDNRVAELLQEIPHGTSANLSLVFKSGELGNIPDGFGLMIPAAEKRKISALTLSSMKWKNRVPDPAFKLVRVFVGGYRNREIALMDDKDLMRVVQQDLFDLFGVSANPMKIFIHRWIKERPQYTLGHRERVRSIEELLSGHAGLFLAGCSYHGIGVGDCVASGLTASQAAIDFVSKLRQQ